ncbi:MAG: endonuclease/exonuclease/phosphatase family protein [Bacteroidales bacterium]|nr:endonuclease/exonuclease/phosphatase family protein [Bacteroidales bacterium]
MKRIFICCIIYLLPLALFSQRLTVASYNIRNDNPEDKNQGNGWEQRNPVIQSMISFYDFDLWGAQEVLHNQLIDLLEGLTEYDYIGVGRDDGETKGEYAPIFYKKEKMQKLESGHFWLSEETDYPNKGWDAVLPRICTWGKFQDKSSKKKFWFFNLHMDHVGIKARSESAKLVIAKIKEMCGKDPVILSGDFNVDQTSPGYAVLHNSGVLQDTYEIAEMRFALNGTFNAFNPNSMTVSRIDHIFVSSSFKVVRYGVLTDT